MAIANKSGSNGAGYSPATNQTFVNVPNAAATGLAIGDLLCIFVVCSQDDTSITAYNIAAVSGNDTGAWTVTYYGWAANGTPAMAVFTKIRQSGNTATQWQITKTGGISSSWLAHLVVFTGVDTANPIAAGPAAATETADEQSLITAPTLTIPAGLSDQAMWVTWHTCARYTNGVSPVSGLWTVTGELVDISSDWNRGVTASALVDAGPTGTKDATFTGNTSQGGNRGRGISIALRPAATAQTIDLALITITATPQAVSADKAEDVATLSINVTPQSISIEKVDDVSLITTTLTPQALTVEKAVLELGVINLSVTPQGVTTESGAKTVDLDLVTISVTPQSVVFELYDPRVYLDPDTVNIAITPQAISMARELTVSAIQTDVTIPSVILHKEIALGVITIDVSPQDVTAIGPKIVGWVDITTTLPAINLAKVIDVGVITINTTPQTAFADRAVNLPEVTTTLSLPTVSAFIPLGPIEISITLPSVTVGFGVDDTTKKQLARTDIIVQPTRVIAQDILTGRFLHWDLEVNNLTLTKTLSGAQLISGEFSNEIRDLKDAGLDAWATWIHVEENGIIRGSGILQPRTVDQNEALSLDAVGVSAYAAGIPYLNELIDVDLDPADIVREMWAHIQSFPNGDLGVVVRGTTPVRIGQTPVDPPAEGEDTRTDEEKARKPYSLVWWEAKDIAQEVNSLAGETPFDFVEREEWNADKTDVLHYIDIGYPRIGRYRNDLRFAQDENLVTAIGPGETDDFYASQVVFIGSGEGRETIRGYAGKPMGGRLRRVVVIDDKSVDNTIRANALSSDELLRRQALQDVTEVEIDARHLNARLGSFDVGDDIPVVAEVPWIGDVRQWERVLSYTYSPDAETVRVTLRRSESFNYGSGASTA